jgi:GntR family transcriptional regulator, transcriptional repressor for pyruvate dehydrogenase complex
MQRPNGILVYSLVQKIHGKQEPMRTATAVSDTFARNASEGLAIAVAHDTPDAMEAIRAPASYELVVDQIRRAIHLGRFLPGQKLPTERELARQLAVSRTTVREAVRVLQGEGLVETRRGRAGGATVLGSSLSQAARRRLLRSRLAELETVFEFRLVVEPAAARLAAERRTKRTLDRLSRDLEVMNVLAQGADLDASPPSRFFSTDIDFHHKIAEASRNPLLVRAVEDARAALFLPVGGIFPALHHSANYLHAEILDAIEAKDANRAEEAMINHIASTQEALLALSRPP